MEFREDTYMSYTIDEVMNCADRVEIINGDMITNAATTTTHAWVVAEMGYAFRQYIKEHDGECMVFHESVNLYCDELADFTAQEWYEPDIMVVCDRSGIKDNGIHTVPKFIAEITSPSTKRFDYSVKLSTYQRIGVPEYWVVDIQKGAVVKYLKDNDYAPIIMTDMSHLEVSVFPELIIDVSEYVNLLL